MKRYLFAYGTLQPGQGPPKVAHAAGRLRLIGPGFVRGRLYRMGKYPAAVLSNKGSLIHGQVFQLADDPEILARLDEYEGLNPHDPESSLFIRQEWPVVLEKGKRKATCWIYTYNRHPGAAPRVARTRSSKGDSRSDG